MVNVVKNVLVKYNEIVLPKDGLSSRMIATARGCQRARVKPAIFGPIADG